MPSRRKDPGTRLDPLSLAVGSRVALLREERDVTPASLAERAGMDPNYLWRIEEGRQNLSLRNAGRLAKALGVTLSQLFDGIDVSDVELGSRPYVRRGDRSVS